MGRQRQEAQVAKLPGPAGGTIAGPGNSEIVTDYIEKNLAEQIPLATLSGPCAPEHALFSVEHSSNRSAFHRTTITSIRPRRARQDVVGEADMFRDRDRYGARL